MLLGPMLPEPHRVESLVMTACCIHNLLCNRDPRIALEAADREIPGTHELQNGAWRQTQGELVPLQPVYGRYGGTSAKSVRDHLKAYCSSPEGSVPWQDRMLEVSNVNIGV